MEIILIIVAFFVVGSAIYESPGIFAAAIVIGAAAFILWRALSADKKEKDPDGAENAENTENAEGAEGAENADGLTEEERRYLGLLKDQKTEKEEGEK